MTTIALRDKELKDIHQILKKTAETEKGSRQSIEAYNRRVTELQLVNAAHQEELTRTVSTDGLSEDALAALNIFRDRLTRGEGITEAALGAAGYGSLDVDAATATGGRHEIRAFEALLACSSWRQQLVLWLLGATKTR
jgi:hypothetical protein